MTHNPDDMTTVTFKTVRDILPRVDSVSKGRKIDIYLTCDMDWCHEAVLADTLNIIDQNQMKATLFVTNYFPSLDLIRNNSRIELGIHPNFNELLNGNQTQGSAERIVDDLLKVIPEAKSIRSHSLVQSGNLTKLFLSKGLTHESNMKIPLGAASEISPFWNSSGMIMCPFQWGDYSDHGISFKSLQPMPSYFMVNFHPIHVFLNTEHLTRYELTRHLHHNPNELIKHRYQGEGTRTRLMELLGIANQM